MGLLAQHRQFVYTCGHADDWLAESLEKALEERGLAPLNPAKYSQVLKVGCYDCITQPLIMRSEVRGTLSSVAHEVEAEDAKFPDGIMTFMLLLEFLSRSWRAGPSDEMVGLFHYWGYQAERLFRRHTNKHREFYDIIESFCGKFTQLEAETTIEAAKLGRRDSFIKIVRLWKQMRKSFDQMNRLCSQEDARLWNGQEILKCVQDMIHTTLTYSSIILGPSQSRSVLTTDALKSICGNRVRDPIPGQDDSALAQVVMDTRSECKTFRAHLYNLEHMLRCQPSTPPELRALHDAVESLEGSAQHVHRYHCRKGLPWCDPTGAAEERNLGAVRRLRKSLEESFVSLVERRDNG